MMKNKLHFIFAFVLMLCPLFAGAQEKGKIVNPEFPGGQEALSIYVRNRVSADDIPFIPQNDTILKCTVGFRVDTLGRMEGFKIYKDPGYGLGEQVVKALKSCPTLWKPGKNRNGKPFAASYVLPLYFHVDGTPQTEEKPKTKKE